MSPVDLHTVVEGPEDAPVVILVNSLGSDLTMWEPQAMGLRCHFRVVRFDLRGHGSSPVPPGPYSIADFGADVIALMDRLEIERASIAGVSLGGMVAIWLGAHARDRVEGLVLCCTSAALGPPQAWAERAALVREQGTAAVAGSVVSRWLTPELAVTHPDLVAELEAMVSATRREGYASSCAAIENMDLRPELAAITAPTLVVSASRDPATPPSHGREIAAEIEGARFVELPDAAHLANYEQPDLVTGLITEHVKSAPHLTGATRR
jgi:3-oxoadipate enol-lactonase